VKGEVYYLTKIDRLFVVMVMVGHGIGVCGLETRVFVLVGLAYIECIVCVDCVPSFYGVTREHSAMD